MSAPATPVQPGHAAVMTSSGRGFMLPTWFLTGVLACFLSVSVVLAGVAISSWADIRDNTKENQSQEVRISRLEQTAIDMAVVKSQMIDINRKLDWLMNSVSAPPQGRTEQR